LLEQEAFLPPAAKREVVRNGDLLKQGIERIIRTGIKRGEIREIDTKMATFCVFAICNYTLRWINPKGAYPYEKLGELYFDFFFEGIKKTPHSP
jgi:hypothetical protein